MRAFPFQHNHDNSQWEFNCYTLCCLAAVRFTSLISMIVHTLSLGGIMVCCLCPGSSGNIYYIYYIIYNIYYIYIYISAVHATAGRWPPQLGCGVEPRNPPRWFRAAWWARQLSLRVDSLAMRQVVWGYILPIAGPKQNL